MFTASTSLRYPLGDIDFGALPRTIDTTKTRAEGSERSPKPAPRILAVDDDPHIRRFVTRALSEAGYDVTAVEDAESGMAQLLAARPDLFLLDINLPGMNGIVLTQKLQEQRATRQVPVVILSVRTDPRDKVAAYASGAVTYLEKPFKKQDLLDAVKLALELAPRRARAGPG